MWPVLLAPLLGGVARSGGSKYESSSIGSTTLSGKSCSKRERLGLRVVRGGTIRDGTHVQAFLTGAFAVDDRSGIEVEIRRQIGRMVIGNFPTGVLVRCVVRRDTRRPSGRVRRSHRSVGRVRRVGRVRHLRWRIARLTRSQAKVFAFAWIARYLFIQRLFHRVQGIQRIDGFAKVRQRSPVRVLILQRTVYQVVRRPPVQRAVSVGLRHSRHHGPACYTCKCERFENADFRFRVIDARTVHVGWNIRRHRLVHVVPAVERGQRHAPRRHGFVHLLIPSARFVLLLRLYPGRQGLRWSPVRGGVYCDLLHIRAVERVQYPPHVLIHFQTFQLRRFTVSTDTLSDCTPRAVEEGSNRSEDSLADGTPPRAPLAIQL